MWFALLWFANMVASFLVACYAYNRGQPFARTLLMGVFLSCVLSMAWLHYLDYRDENGPTKD